MSQQNKAYPQIPDYGRIIDQIRLYVQLKHEYGADDIDSVLAGAEEALKSALAEMQALLADQELAAQEPNELPQIQQLRPQGPRKLWSQFDETKYRERLEGALLGRFAGCTLGAPVEFWSIERMEQLAKDNGTTLPPTGGYSFKKADKLKVINPELGNRVANVYPEKSSSTEAELITSITIENITDVLWEVQVESEKRLLWPKGTIRIEDMNFVMDSSVTVSIRRDVTRVRWLD